MSTSQWLLGTAQGYFGIGFPRCYHVRPPFLAHSVKLRTGTSDYGVFRQIMIEREYGPLKNLRVNTVLDLGANIGLASIWFLNQFPNAKVLAVEADQDNFKICCENLAPYGNRARVLHGAAWARRTKLSLHRKSCSADNWVQEDGKGKISELTVEGWDLSSLIEMSGFKQIDLLKIDIEGAEEHIFRSDPSNWLSRVRNLCIELHGPACKETFFHSLSAFQYQHDESGELDLCTDLQLKRAD